MRGDSLVRTTHVLDTNVQKLLDEPRVPEPAKQFQKSLSMVRTLSDLTETVSSGMPLPPLPNSLSEEHDDVVGRVIDSAYSSDPVELEDLESDLEPALRDGRLSRDGSFLHIPLDETARTGRNWWLVFKFVRSRLAGVEGKTRRLLNRVQQAPRSTTDGCWESVIRMIQKLCELMIVALTRQTWFRYHTRYDRQLVESIGNVAELLGFERPEEPSHV